LVPANPQPNGFANTLIEKESADFAGFQVPGTPREKTGPSVKSEDTSSLMRRLTRSQVTILSSVHQALDNRVFYREARTLANAGYDVTLIAVHDRDEVKDGIRIRALPRVPRRNRPLLWRKLVRMAVETGADAYHIHDPELLLITPWLRRRTGKPTIYDIHEANADFMAVKDYLPGWVRPPLAGLVRSLEPRLARREKGLIFADEAIARSFNSFTGPKVTLFNYPGAELIQQGETGGQPYAERPPVVLYLGGLERNRGADLMIDTFARVRREIPAARLLIVGHFQPAELEQEVRADAERCGLANAVTITGRVPFDQIGDYLRQARVGWVTWQNFPKNEKNIPTKLFEYMAFGLPVVSSDLASVRPFISPGKNGILVPASDPEAHASDIVHLLRHPEKAREIGLSGRHKVVETFNWAKMEPRLLAFYKDLGLSLA
jgi:glycosyltransferase involved in cell wall biosynthesis